MKKDLIEIVTEERSYYIKGDYNKIKRDLKYVDDSTWVEFDELTELLYTQYIKDRKVQNDAMYKESKIDKLLLRVHNIIAVYKLRERIEES